MDDDDRDDMIVEQRIAGKSVRASRNVAFIATLLERRADFVCRDDPTATKFTIHILAVVAEFERDAISARTKAALAAAKANGKKLGNIGVSLRPSSERRPRALKPCEKPFSRPPTSRHAFPAEALNRRGITTASGRRWQAMQVHRVRHRLGL